jgi:hypothetical protein
MNVPKLVSSPRNLRFLMLALLSLAYLQALRLGAGAPFSGSTLLVQAVFIVGVFLLVEISRPRPAPSERLIWTPLTFVPFLLLLLVGAAYLFLPITFLAWLGLALFYAGLLIVDTALSGIASRLVRLLVQLLLAAWAGAAPILLAETLSNFAEEEFFAALQMLGLTGLWLLLRYAWSSLEAARRREAALDARIGHAPAGLRLHPGFLAAGLGVLSVIALVGVVRAYQQSFYPTTAPVYAPINQDNPFICGPAAQETQTYDGLQVQSQMMALMAEKPTKSTPEVGMLALGTGDQVWAQEFKDRLMQEAAVGIFTEPANSVKSTQFEAALRAYYYPRLVEAFPGLFNTGERQQIEDWFEAINRRAMTVEWVDWMYALAFNKKPQGPYENQENGAGLLALLEMERLSAPALESENRQYLADNPRGWQQRFRVTDDAIVYQPEWIYNAYFQSLYTRAAPFDNVEHSFEWLLFQAPPDGSPLRYNHPAAIKLGPVAYLGANLISDERLVWLAGRAMEYLQEQGGYPPVAPGAERTTAITGKAPQQGSCLLYGDSGLPNQIGPLAPDKIVLRDGWSSQSLYLLLNLRFSGWHRYKATNAVTLLYQEGPLAVENLSGEDFAWLPTGRSLFRDKRVPRENLNGLLVERSGLGAVLYTLSGIGGPWAQDPPYYARVDEFENQSGMDTSRTLIEDWHGWDQSREIALYHQGPVLVYDQAEKQGYGPAAAISWHFVLDEPGEGQNLPTQAGRPVRLRLRGGEHPAEIVLLPLDSGVLQLEPETIQDQKYGLRALYKPQPGDQLGLVSIFLTEDWRDAQVVLEMRDGQRIVSIFSQGRQVELPLVDNDK